MEDLRDYEEDEKNEDSDSDTANDSVINKSLFLDKVRQSNIACQNGDYFLAIQLYSEAITLDPTNHILFSNRSAAFIKIEQYEKALQDAIHTRELNPKWAKAYFRQGVALQCLGRYADALAAFASGLAQEPKNSQLLSALIEAALKSPLKGTLESIYDQLQKMRLDKSPFVVISVIGQELLAQGHHASSIVVLESALRVGTCSQKLRGSVFSALSSAYWGLGNLDKAMMYMQQDLSITKLLGDQIGECRAHGNLGSAYFAKSNYKEALSNHRFQLVLALKNKDTRVLSSVLTSLGHIYSAIEDYPNALASHKQCVQLLKQMGDYLHEAREIGNVGTIYLAMGEFDNSVECHKEHLKMAKQAGSKSEEARAYSNLGSAYHYKRNYDQAISFHNHVLQIALELKDNMLEARAYAGLGHAARCMGDLHQARKWHENQLDMALITKDKTAEGRACSNLGIIYQLQHEYEIALKLHQANLKIVQDLQDRAGIGRAYGNIGNAYSALNLHEQAVKFHKLELNISKDVNDRSSEASTHGNLAVTYQALGMQELALQHYHLHLNIARELKDTASEARALCNLGSYHSNIGEFNLAVPYFENYLMLSQELHDIEGEGRACHFLGYAHYSLSNYNESVRYYDQDLALSKDLRDHLNMGRAYCNLGLAHLALGHLDQALECQKYFFAIAYKVKNVMGKFRALGNIGDILMKMKKTSDAVKVYIKQLALARQGRDKMLEGVTLGALGIAHRVLGHFDKALGYHTQELTIYQELNDLKGEYKAHRNIGAIYTALGKYNHAVKCYEEQLERAKDLKNNILEAQAYGNAGITKMNMGLFEEAIGSFEQQLATLEQVSGNTALSDKGHAYGNLGDCYEALGDHEEAAKCHELFLTIAQKNNNSFDQERAYLGLGNAHRALGNLQQALVCFEKRLVVAHELDSQAARASAYGELGCLHSLLGNFEQAVSCLEHQLDIARQTHDKLAEGEAVCGLGGVYQQMGECEMSLRYHQIDLKIADEMGNIAVQGRAYGNLGVAHELLGNFEQAIVYQEQHLSIAAQINDRIAKTLAFSSLGRIHHALGNLNQAVTYLQQGLQIAEQLGRREDEAKIRHRLGLALWGQGELEEAQHQLYRAADLFEIIRREAQINSDYKLSLFDLQTASYQALQRVLVSLNRQNEALVVAERGRTRAFIDLLLERQTGNDKAKQTTILDSTVSTIEQIVELVNRKNATVLYYSIAAGFLYSWLIVPYKGVIRFSECNINDIEPDTDGTIKQGLASTSIVLDMYISQVREALGVEISPCGNYNKSIYGDVDSEGEDQQFEVLNEKLNQENDRTGFLRLVNRNHVFNTSNYSLNSLLSLNSSTGGSTSDKETSKKRRIWSGPPPLRALYDILIAPVEDVLPKRGENLVLVLQGDIYLVPFAVLKGNVGTECLYERFKLVMAPSITALQESQIALENIKSNHESVPALVVANPTLPSSVTERWQWGDITYTEQEGVLVSELLGTKALTGFQATKETVIKQLYNAECIHFATHVSWKLSAIILSPGEHLSISKRHSHCSNHNGLLNIEQLDIGDDGSGIENATDTPSLSEFLLTAADILNIKLSAKLVVLSFCYTRNQHGKATSDGVVGLTRAFLAAGAQCVLVSLWPVPDTAVRILMQTFYSGLLQGVKASHALSEAMYAVQNTKQFAHPANWAGFLLIGNDAELNSRVPLMMQALCEILKTPERCKDAFRVALHLIEKSLQRIHRGLCNPMYTSQQSIENKIGSVQGWKDLLASVGFRFEVATSSLPASVFFPQADVGECLTRCSASLQALLGLCNSSLMALSKLLASSDMADSITTVIRQVLNHYLIKDRENSSFDISVNVKLWQIPGCHELLASLGFDLMEVGCDRVTLRTGKQANKRTMQFALQALISLFDTQEGSKSLLVEDLSLMENLESSNGSSSNHVASSPVTQNTINEKSDVVFMGNSQNSLSYVIITDILKNNIVPNSSPDIALVLHHQNKVRSMVVNNLENEAKDEKIEPPQISVDLIPEWKPNESQKQTKPPREVCKGSHPGYTAVTPVRLIKPSIKNCEEKINSTLSSEFTQDMNKHSGLNPTEVALKILAETQTQRAALEQMQRLSMNHQLWKSQITESQEENSDAFLKTNLSTYKPGESNSEACLQRYSNKKVNIKYKDVNTISNANLSTDFSSPPSSPPPKPRNKHSLKSKKEKHKHDSSSESGSAISWTTNQESTEEEELSIQQLQPAFHRRCAVLSEDGYECPSPRMDQNSFSAPPLPPKPIKYRIGSVPPPLSNLCSKFSPDLTKSAFRPLDTKLACKIESENNFFTKAQIHQPNVVSSMVSNQNMANKYDSRELRGIHNYCYEDESGVFDTPDISHLVAAERLHWKPNKKSSDSGEDDIRLQDLNENDPLLYKKSSHSKSTSMKLPVSKSTRHSRSLYIDKNRKSVNSAFLHMSQC